MKRIAAVIFLCFALLLGAAVPGLCAGESLYAAHEESLLRLINDARRDVRSAAEAAGVDCDAALAALPELAEIAEKGLPPLVENDLLKGLAAERASVMVDSYGGSFSEEDLSYLDRMTAVGYRPVDGSETIGALGFSNYLEPGEAVRILFANMLRSELDPARVEPRGILNAGIEEIGISIASGLFTDGGFHYNAYVSACGFGTSIASYERFFAQLINQFRTRPAVALSAMGIDAGDLLQERPELADYIAAGMPPLAVDPAIAEAARLHALELLEAGRLDELSIDGRGPVERLADQGYSPAEVAEARRTIHLCGDVATDFRVAHAASEMIAEELLDEETAPALLKGHCADLGIALARGISEGFDTICGNEVFVAVADAAAPAALENPVISLTVFDDRDGDGLYGYREGRPGVSIVLSPAFDSALLSEDTAPVLLKTDTSGGVALRTAPGRYRISVDMNGAEQIVYATVAWENVQIWIMAGENESGEPATRVLGGDEMP